MLEVEGSDTVESVKAQLQAKQGILITPSNSDDDQLPSLVFAGKQLEARTTASATSPRCTSCSAFVAVSGTGAGTPASTPTSWRLRSATTRTRWFAESMSPRLVYMLDIVHISV
jgi:hypothetical protein